MDQNTDPTKQDVNKDALADMTVTPEVTMEPSIAEAPVAEVLVETPEAPQATVEVSMPPQDAVVEAPAQSEEENIMVTVKSSEPEQEAQPPTATSNDAPPEPKVISTSNIDPAPLSGDKPKKTGKGLIVAIAVVLALVLAAIAVLVYMKANNSTKNTEAAKTTPAQTSQVAKDPLLVKDVDAAAAQLDSTLTGLDDAKDFAADTISDKTLGLQ